MKKLLLLLYVSASLLFFQNAFSQLDPNRFSRDRFKKLKKIENRLSPNRLQPLKKRFIPLGELKELRQEVLASVFQYLYLLSRQYAYEDGIRTSHRGSIPPEKLYLVDKSDLDLFILAMTWIESSNQDNITSPAGAHGPLQFMPATWLETVKRYAKAHSIPYSVVSARTYNNYMKVGRWEIKRLKDIFGTYDDVVCYWYSGKPIWKVKKEGWYFNSQKYNMPSPSKHISLVMYRYYRLKKIRSLQSSFNSADKTKVIPKTKIRRPTELKQAKPAITKPSLKTPATTAIDTSSYGFSWPCNSRILFDEGGYQVEGINIQCEPSDTAKCTGDGLIVFAGKAGEEYYINMVMVEHKNYFSLYANLNKIFIKIKKGQTIKRETPIGISSTNPGNLEKPQTNYLRFEIRGPHGVENPLRFLPKK